MMAVMSATMIAAVVVADGVTNEVSLAERFFNSFTNETEDVNAL